jgi:hypothetical protein
MAFTIKQLASFIYQHQASLMLPPVIRLKDVAQRLMREMDDALDEATPSISKISKIDAEMRKHFPYGMAQSNNLGYGDHLKPFFKKYPTEDSFVVATTKIAAMFKEFEVLEGDLKPVSSDKLVVSFTTNEIIQDLTG